MKLFLVVALVLITDVTFAPASLAQGQTGQTSPPSQPVLPADPPLDLGTFDGSIYSNEYFGVAFTVPKTWTILDLGVKKAMKEGAKGLFQDEKNAQLKRDLEASVDRTTNLFSATKLAPGTTSAFNAALVCAAERIPTALIKTSLDYHTALVRSVGSSEGVDIEIVEPYRTRRIGATDFGTFGLKVTLKTGVLMQKYIVMIKAPYVFALVFNYIDENDVRTFDEVVGSIRVK